MVKLLLKIQLKMKSEIIKHDNTVTKRQFETNIFGYTNMAI